jgi:WD40 repeat protein
MSEPAITAGVEPYESATALQEAHGRLLEAFDRQLGDDPGTEAELTALSRLEPEIRVLLERGAATGIYLEDIKERTAAQVLLDYWVSSLAQAALGAPPARLAPFDGDQLPDLRDKPCPYVGLDAFRGPEFFYGRDRDIADLVAQVTATPLVVVLGASGSGKSSLVMGGVLPVLAGPQASVRLHMVPPIVPRGDAFVHLAAAILSREAADATVVEAAARLRDDPAQLEALLGEASGGGPSLLVIDQFEEVFTLTEDEHQRSALAAALATALGSPRGHRAILTMREEFRSRLVQLRALGHLLDRAWYSMRPMGYDELTAAVERPAAVVNLQFQPGIVDDLVKRVLGQPAALPLLQFTLRRLWDQRRRNRITWEVYRDVGDPLTALDETANQFIDGLVPEMQDEAKRVLLELVRVDELLEAYRQPVPKARLLAAGRANTPAVLRVLEEHEFIRVSREDESEIVEVKHESLVRNWRRFVGWIDEKRIARRQRLALSQAAARWAEQGRPAAGLLTGWQLEEARRQPDLDGLEREFVETSARRVAEAAQEEVRRARQTVGLALAVCVALLLFAVALFFQRRQAEDARRRAESALGLASTQEAARLVDAGRPDHALAHLARALRTDPESVAARSWIASLLLNEPLWVPGPPIEHRAPIGALAVSPDGRRLVTAASTAARIWDLAAATSIGAPIEHAGDVRSVAFSPDGRRVLTASADGTARLWEVESGSPVGLPLQHEDPVRTAAFSPDGRRIVTASRDVARLWDGATQRPIGRPLQHSNEVFMASFAPDGTRIVTAAGEGAVQWDVASGRRLDWTVQHADLVLSAVFSPSGTSVLTASLDDTARVWDARSGEELLGLRHQNDVLSARFSASGGSVLTASSDNSARVWDAYTGQPIGGSLPHPGPVTDARFGPDGLSVVTASESSARRWESTRGHQPTVLLDNPARLVTAAFAGDGRVLTASAVSAHVWDAITGKELFDSHLQPDGGIATAAFTRDGRRIVFAADNKASVWETGPVRPVSGPIEHGASVRAVAFSPDGTRIVTASDDGTARVSDARTGGAVGALLRHENAVVSAEFSLDGSRVLTASLDGTARIWDAATGEPASPPLRHEDAPGEITLAVLSPDTRRVVTASPYGTARIWDAASGRQIGPTLEHRGPVSSAAFSPDGRRVVTASADRTARVWDTETGQRIGDALTHQAAVVSAVFSRDGLRVLTASRDGTARVWSAITGQPAGVPLRHPFGLQGALFAPDGQRVVTVTIGTAALVWRVMVDTERGLSLDALRDLAELMGGVQVTEMGSVAPLTEDERRERVGRVLGPQAPLYPSAQALLARVRQRTR